ncbi:xylose isomerase [Meiothermus sp. CFH 77666]|uniref:xylose isomerase n=1 Tax=Meiothermus sp. CFH 77666 TaxID=2817942 RepID=UPI001AA01FDE|nr:xylose isomerase [Meiothermus sp. CFH 77666]MBO1436148.1 xylose isomerase [Meiothermus sp. CFH 77666]
MYEPRPEHKFTFGLWTVGNVGRDPFGEAVRARLEPDYVVYKLAELGAYGVNLHDEDLIPRGTPPAERATILRRFKKALEETGLKVPMVTANLFSDPAFKDGALTSPDPWVRAYALKKSLETLDLGAELGAQIYVVWPGREGAEVDATGKAQKAWAWFREALNFLAAYSEDQGYGYRFALEPKPNEPRGDIYLPTVGSMLALIHTLEQPQLFGLNPEFAHETMAGLNFVHAVAQALDAGKLFHIDLNDQRMSRFDQDLRFGAENLKASFFLVDLLEHSGYAGPRHFDAHALRTEDEAGVWAFARGCMRTYLILKEKAQAFRADPEVRSLLDEYYQADPEPLALLGSYSREKAEKLKGLTLPEARRTRGYALEALDQLAVEHLLGVRG